MPSTICRCAVFSRSTSTDGSRAKKNAGIAGWSPWMRWEENIDGETVQGNGRAEWRGDKKRKFVIIFFAFLHVKVAPTFEFYEKKWKPNNSSRNPVIVATFLTRWPSSHGVPKNAYKQEKSHLLIRFHFFFAKMLPHFAFCDFWVLRFAFRFAIKKSVSLQLWFRTICQSIACARIFSGICRVYAATLSVFWAVSPIIVC